MPVDPIVFNIFLIFTGAAVMSTIALYTRQSLLVAYMLLGVMLGPWGLKWVDNSELVGKIGEVGITFLLFLVGLHLQPQNLYQMFRKVTLVSLISSIIFFLLGYGVCMYFGFNYTECLIVGAAIMFSSTIIGLKLLPTTILHHQHIGEIIISVLLMQDLIAIIVILFLQSTADELTIKDITLITFALPGLIAIAIVVEKYIINKLLVRFDQIQEYIFLLSIGWCLGLAHVGSYLGVSAEIGAFVAGVALTTSPICLYIAESLKPLRDFFLVMFFFSIGAGFNFNFLQEVLLPAFILALLMLLLKPLVYYWLLRQVGEDKSVSFEVGVRLGQASEFSLLVVAIAATSALVSERVNYLVQAATIFTFIASSYIVVLKYPTPLAFTENMRRD